MEHLPIYVALTGRACLVVGGGSVAARKATLLRRAGAAVTVVAPALVDALRKLHKAGEIDVQLQPYAPELLAGHWLIIAATDDDTLNSAIAVDADRAGLLCNAVDNLSASSFILPAIVERGPVTVAIGTGGRAPVLARRLKARLEAWLPARIGRLAERAGQWRDLVRRRFATLDERRRFWQGFFDGPIAADLLAGREREADDAMRRELLSPVGAAPAGEGWIVGAGPGDPGLVTLKAQQLLGNADVVLYDRLVSAGVLDMARKEAELIPVGKSAGRALMSQDGINALLVEQVRAGKRVCRLKGGDPFIFGRGGEEAHALAEAGLPFQIVPGISAALGCAAYAGIPLTLRGVSASVTFATARVDDGRYVEWSNLARAGDTLALYMSTGTLAETCRQLIVHGASPAVPAAMVASGTTSGQQVVVATLADIAATATRAGIAAPAMLFVGEAVASASALGWFSAPASGGGSAFAALEPSLASAGHA